MVGGNARDGDVVVELVHISFCALTLIRCVDLETPWWQRSEPIVAPNGHWATQVDDPALNNNNHSIVRENMRKYEYLSGDDLF